MISSAEEGIAARAFVDRIGEARRARVGPEQVAQQLVNRFRGQRQQRELSIPGLLHPRRVILGPEVHEQQRLRARGRVDHLCEPGLAARVDPVQVFDEDDGDVVALLDYLAHGVEELALARIRIGRQRRSIGVGYRHEVEHDGKELAKALIEQQQPAGDLFARRAIGVLFADPEVLPEDLQDGKKWDVPAVCDGRAPQHGEPARTAALDELEAQAALGPRRPPRPRPRPGRLPLRA